MPQPLLLFAEDVAVGTKSRYHALELEI